MQWLSRIDQTAPTLPAAWLIATTARPANLPERATLRRSLARAVLASQFGLAPEAVAIGHEPAGRPVIAAPHGTGLHLSLATRSGLVAIALAHEPVGIDVEHVDPAGSVPLSILHPDERSWLAALPDTAHALAFAQLWSAKEAYVKALGLGLVRPPESFAVRFDGSDRFAVEDRENGGVAQGFVTVTKSGGQETLTAAFVTL